jgi:hypothetical protein
VSGVESSSQGLGKVRWREMHTGDPCGDLDSLDVVVVVCNRFIMALRMEDSID